MKIIVVGYGRMGAGLAIQLENDGHQVSVIDSNPDRQKALDKQFKGQFIVGVGFDKETLEKAGIDQVDAIVSCTNSDETNALIGRVARNIYRVPTVIARLYDPRKATIYNALGIRTISTTTWGIQKTIELITFRQFDTITTLGDADVEIVRVDAPGNIVGRRVQDLSVIGEMQVVSITRDNKAFIPTQGSTIQKNDTLVIAVSLNSVARLKSILGIV